MITVPVKTKIYIPKIFYIDFLLPITSMIQTILKPFYLKACQLNPNPENDRVLCQLPFLILLHVARSSKGAYIPKL